MQQALLQAVGLKATADIPVRHILTPDWDRLAQAGLRPTPHNRRVLDALAQILRLDDETDPRGSVITSASALASLFRSRARMQEQEHLWLVTLNAGLKVLGDYELSKGGSISCFIDNRDITRKALFDRASSVIILHNHPSGNPTPSATDMRATESLRNALSAFDIALTDHIVLGRDSYYSFADEMQSKY